MAEEIMAGQRRGAGTRRNGDPYDNEKCSHPLEDIQRLRAEWKELTRDYYEAREWAKQALRHYNAELARFKKIYDRHFHKLDKYLK